MWLGQKAAFYREAIEAAERPEDFEGVRKKQKVVPVEPKQELIKKLDKGFEATPGEDYETWQEMYSHVEEVESINNRK